MSTTRRCFLVYATSFALLGAPGLPGDRLRAEEAFQKVDVFVGGKLHSSHGCRSHFLPAIVLTKQNTLLAFGEGRTKKNRWRHGDILLRRSTDGGQTWGPVTYATRDGQAGNPCAVVDRDTGTVWLAYCRKNHRVFVTSSTDDGMTWNAPVEITGDVKKPDWGFYATGPGHGIQLSSGRLLIPCDYKLREHWDVGKEGAAEPSPHVPGGEAKIKRWVEAGGSHVIYSDDHGKSWKLGGLVDNAMMDECEAVELADRSVLLCMRHYLGHWGDGKEPLKSGQGSKQRAFATSADGGLSWSKPTLNPEVHCPVCQASIIRYTLRPAAGKNRILYSGPGGPGRSNLTVRLSYDEGKTWPVAKVIHPGSAAYSDLVVLPDGRIGCLYTHSGWGKTSFARFTLEWLTDGKDKLTGGEDNT